MSYYFLLSKYIFTLVYMNILFEEVALPFAKTTMYLLYPRECILLT